MTMDGLFENAQHAYSTDVVSLTLIRKYARTSWRWMEAYRRQLTEDWSPELTAFAAKSYHGHRGVPPTMDRIIEELASHKRLKAVERGRELLDRDSVRVRARERGDGDLPDLNLIDPAKLIGLTIRKDFDGFGLCKRVIRSTDFATATSTYVAHNHQIDG